MKTIKLGGSMVAGLWTSLLCLSPSTARADTHTAASCSYADVAAAVAAASDGDTVTVPAGTATWDSTLTITNGITLCGAGNRAPRQLDGVILLAPVLRSDLRAGSSSPEAAL